jgi:hypothetical protein
MRQHPATVPHDLSDRLTAEHRQKYKIRETDQDRDQPARAADSFV